MENGKKENISSQLIMYTLVVLTDNTLVIIIITTFFVQNFLLWSLVRKVLTVPPSCLTLDIRFEWAPVDGFGCDTLRILGEKHVLVEGEQKQEVAIFRDLQGYC